MNSTQAIIAHALATQPTREEILEQLAQYGLSGEEAHIPVEQYEARRFWTPAGIPDIEWGLECIAESEAEIAAIQEQAKAAIAAIKERAAAITRRAEDRVAFFQERLAVFAEANKGDLLIGKKKSRDLIHGTLAWRKKPAKLVVKNAEELEAWLPTQDPALSRIKVEPNMAALKELTATSGVIPPGCDYEPERDELSIKAVPLPTLTATVAKKELTK